MKKRKIAEFKGVKNIHFTLAVLTVIFLLCKDEKKTSVSIDNFCAKFAEAIDNLSLKMFSCTGSSLLNPKEYRRRCEILIGNAEKVIEKRKSVSFNSKNAELVIGELIALSNEKCENLIKLQTLKRFSSIVYVAEKKILEGKLNENDKCFFNFECQSGLCGGRSCPGICISPVGEGEKCYPDASDSDLGEIKPCREGLVCYKDSCTRSGSAGAPCALDIHCEDEFICVKGICQKPTPAGAYCESDTPCEYLYRCNFEQKLCVNIKYAKEGESCGDFGNEIVLCDFSKNYCSEKKTCEPLPKEGQDCVIPGIATPRISERQILGLFRYSQCQKGLYCAPDRKCRKLPQEGENCNLICAEGLTCIAGKCQKVKNVGEVCIYDEQCITSKCYNGICKSDLKSEGESCESDKECQNFNCKGKLCCSPIL